MDTPDTELTQDEQERLDFIIREYADGLAAEKIAMLAERLTRFTRGGATRVYLHGHYQCMRHASPVVTAKEAETDNPPEREVA